MNIALMSVAFGIGMIVELFILGFANDLDLSVFNPIRNYNTWFKINWFGIWVITTILNIVFFPYAIVYWVYKLFTVGRQ